MYTRDEITKKITEIIEELFEIPAEKIQPTSRLYQDLDLDSIDAVDLIVKLQEMIGQRVEPQQFKSVRTIDDVAQVIESILKATPAALDEAR